MLNAAGDRAHVNFSSEDQVVAFMKATREIFAPIAFGYEDGSPLDQKTMERIHERFFRGTAETMAGPILAATER